MKNTEQTSKKQNDGRCWICSKCKLLKRPSRKSFNYNYIQMESHDKCEVKHEWIECDSHGHQEVLQ